MTKKPFILIDGSSYLYRAFHALPALINTEGQPTGAIYGVINMLRKLRNDYASDHIAVVFDPKGKTARHALYSSYKAHRPAMPEELRCQIQPLFRLIRAMGLPLVQIDGIEADDVIATLAKQAEKAGYPVVISTGDKDMAQLVNANITLINTMTDTVFDRQGVIDKFGVPPERIIDYLALVGDSSDNIPGVANVGPKTAVKWLQTYDSVEAIITHASEIAGKIGDNLRANIETLQLAKQLVTLQTDIPLPVTLHDLSLQSADNETLRTSFQQLAFKSWLKELSPDATLAAPQRNYETVLTEQALDKWIQALQQAPLFAFDTETTSLNTLDAQLVGVSVAIPNGFQVTGKTPAQTSSGAYITYVSSEASGQHSQNLKDDGYITPHHAAYIPVAHNCLGAPKQLDRNTVLNRIAPLLQDPQKTIVLQNAKYDMSVLANYNLNITAPLFDTLLASYLTDSTQSRHDLDSLALNHFGKQLITFSDVAGKGKNQLTFNQVDVETATLYAAEDADITLQLYDLFAKKLQAHEKLRWVFEKIELPLIAVLSRMERHGVCIDAEKLRAQSSELATRLKELEDQAHQLAGRVFNLSSPQQLQTVLYQQMQLPVLEKTPKGAPSTAESVLQELALSYLLPKIILEHRSFSKLKSTYTDSLPKQIHPKTGRVHTSYNQAVTSTGRLSSTDPNLQNIPIRHEQGRRIRQAFIAPQNYQLISADYSQVELRIMAHLSQDPALLQAFANQQDIHRTTAADVFGVEFSAVSDEQRRHAKAINFGLIYGMSAFGLAKQLNVDQHIAQAYIKQYFARYPGVEKYMEDTRQQAREQGYVETVCGRRLYVPDINSSQALRRRAAERAAINAPMQGTAADLIKLAMIAVDEWIQSTPLAIKMIMQVHDELVFEVAEKDVNAAMTQISQLMTNAMTLLVPLEVTVAAGNNWDEAH